MTPSPPQRVKIPYVNGIAGSHYNVGDMSLNNVWASNLDWVRIVESYPLINLVLTSFLLSTFTGIESVNIFGSDEKEAKQAKRFVRLFYSDPIDLLLRNHLRIRFNISPKDIYHTLFEVGDFVQVRLFMYEKRKVASKMINNTVLIGISFDDDHSKLPARSFIESVHVVL